jgi:hypothetical protein
MCLVVVGWMQYEGRSNSAAGAFSPVAGSIICGPLLPSHDDAAAIDAPVGRNFPDIPRQSPLCLEHHNLSTDMASCTSFVHEGGG